MLLYSPVDFALWRVQSKYLLTIAQFFCQAAVGASGSAPNLENFFADLCVKTPLEQLTAKSDKNANITQRVELRRPPRFLDRLQSFVLVVLFPTPERFELVPFHNESDITQVASDQKMLATLALAKDSSQGTLFAKHSAITYV